LDREPLAAQRLPEGEAMAIFDQRHQEVQYQFNIAGAIDPRQIQNKNDVARQLELLREEIRRARSAQALDEEVATDVEYRLTKAELQTRKAEPDKQGVLEYLAEARSLLSGVPSTAKAISELVGAVAQMAQQVQVHL
jgi:DNA repair ATPase RecN